MAEHAQFSTAAWEKYVPVLADAISGVNEKFNIGEKLEQLQLGDEEVEQLANKKKLRRFCTYPARTVAVKREREDKGGTTLREKAKRIRHDGDVSEADEEAVNNTKKHNPLEYLPMRLKRIGDTMACFAPWIVFYTGLGNAADDKADGRVLAFFSSTR
ncbi:hypothetical protein AHAS_Ahas15G0162000 [Arachis hypogaea]